MPPKKYKTEEERKAAKRKQDLEAIRKLRGTQKHLTIKQKRFAELIPLARSQTEAAKQAGYSSKTARTIASANLTKIDIQHQIAKNELNLRQHLNKQGLDDENISLRIKNFIDYNSEVVERETGTGRVIKEMRDARGVAKMIENVVKFKGASLENTNNLAGIEVNNATAMLAIKSLVNKLDVEQLRTLVESCEVLIENLVNKEMKIVE